MGRIAKAFALFLTLTIAMSCLPLLTVKPAHAMPNVHLDYTKTTITLQETVNFTAQVSYQANITWYLDDINVKSEINTQSNFTFIPKRQQEFILLNYLSMDSQIHHPSRQ